MSQHFVTVIIPCYNEEKYIAECLDSVIGQDYSKDQLEVYIVDGMSTDKTHEIVLDYVSQYSFLRLINNPERTVSYALNKGITHSKGDVIIRMDAHSFFPSNYISVLVYNLFRLNADNVGGVWKTLPGNDSLMCQAIAIASSHKFGVGNSLHKTGVTKIQQTDTVPYGCFKRDLFNRIGMFDEDLVRNQDDEFNARIINNGGKIFIIPEVIIEYNARTTLSQTARMFYQYGLFKPLVNIKLGAPATVRQFFPPVFVSGIIAGSLLCSYFTSLKLLYWGFIALYCTITLGLSFLSALRHRKPGLLLLLPISFFTIHFSYGCGYIAGIVKFYMFNHISAKVNDNRKYVYRVKSDSREV